MERVEVLSCKLGSRDPHIAEHLFSRSRYSQHTEALCCAHRVVVGRIAGLFAPAQPVAAQVAGHTAYSSARIQVVGILAAGRAALYWAHTALADSGLAREGLAREELARTYFAH